MEFKDKRILVTGGAGFIGSHLVEELIRLGNEVIVLDDYSAGKEANLASVKQSGKLHLVRGTVLDALLVRKLAKEADAIFHLAAHCSRLCFDRPNNVNEVNSAGTLNLLEAVRAINKGTGSRRVKRFIYCSSSEVYGTAKDGTIKEEHTLEPTTIFGASKLSGELHTNIYHSTWGLPTVVVRLFNVYGYREPHAGANGEVIPRFVVRILNNLPPVVFGDGSQTRDFSFVSDAVAGLVNVGSSDTLIGQTVNLGSGQETSIKTIAEKLLKLMGKENLGIKYEPVRPSDLLRQRADVTKLEKITDFRPKIGFEEGLKLYVDWLQSQKINHQQLLNEMTIQNWKTENAEVLAGTRH